MRLVLATPLYPPDIAEPAPYAKELARRLASEHDVTIVTYGRIPETVPGVRIIAIDKRQPLLVRLFRYGLALIRACRGADCLYAENGASVELAAGLVARLTRVPLILHLGDPAAHAHAAQSRLYGAIERFARSAAKRTVDESPAARPELLPLEPRPEAALSAYEASWRAHLTKLEALFTHA